MSPSGPRCWRLDGAGIPPRSSPTSPSPGRELAYSTHNITVDDDEAPEWWWTPSFTTEPLSIEVEVTPNEVVGTFYGCDGEPLFEVYERPWVPFGFQRGQP